LIYDNVKKLADEKKIPITVLEERVGLARGTIGKWQNAWPRINNVVKVAKELDVSVEDLLLEKVQ